MNISIIVKKYATKDGKRTFMGAKARGQYLAGDVKPETNYLVKFTQKSGVSLPAEEGIYDCDISRNKSGEADSVKVWVDSRPEFKDNPVFRIEVFGGDQVAFRKKASLKPFDESRPPLTDESANILDLDQPTK